MSYNGSGTFAINSSGQPVVAGTVISSTVFNSLTADLGTGLSTAITKDGQTTTTARILFAAGISSTLATDATSISTGSILTLGGLGVTKAAWIGGLMNVAGAATFQSTIGITGALTATTINASGLVAMAGAATVGTTLGVTGTATMAAINASGAITGTTISSSSGAITTTTDFKVPTLGYIYAYTGAGGGTVKAGIQLDGAGSIYSKIADTTVTQVTSSGLIVTGTLGVGAAPVSEKFRVQAAAGFNFVVDSASSSMRISAVNDADSLNVPMILQATSINIGGANSPPITIPGTLGVTGDFSVNTNVVSLSASAGANALKLSSTGFLTVGTATAAGNAHGFKSTAAGSQTLSIENANASTPFAAYMYYSAAAPNGTGNEFLICADTGATRATIRSNGGIANFSANNVNLSDIRTKKDIQPAGAYLPKIMAIPVKTFLYNDQTDTDLNLGVIAQDVEAVAPELIDNSGFGETPDDGIPLKAIYQTDLQYALMKALQELAADFQAYKNSHP